MKFTLFQLTTVEFVGFAGWLVIESVSQRVTYALSEGVIYGI
jgi:hypothetical protein